jgi:hypothetical protein
MSAANGLVVHVLVAGVSARVQGAQIVSGCMHRGVFSPCINTPLSEWKNGCEG